MLEPQSGERGNVSLPGFSMRKGQKKFLLRNLEWRDKKEEDKKEEEKKEEEKEGGISVQVCGNLRQPQWQSSKWAI